MANTQFPLAVVLSAVDRLTGPLGRMESRIGRFGKKLTKVGRSMSLGLTLPILGFGAAILSSSSRFEEGMLRVQVLTGKTGEELEEVSNLAKELGSSTVFSASQAADAMGNLALAGFKLNEIVAATPPFLDLATAATMDLAEASEIAAGSLNIYGFEVSQATRVADVLTKGFTSTATNLAELGAGMAAGGAVAAGMGIEFEELVATLGLLGKKLLGGEKGGTAIRGALGRLANATPEAVKRLESLGIPLDALIDGESNVRSLTNTIRILEDAGATTGDVLKIFGQKAGPAMSALIEQGADALESLTISLRDSAGTAAEKAGVKMEGAAGGVRGMKSAFEGLTIAIGESGLLEWFTLAVGKLTEWFQALSETNPEILKIGTVVAITAAALGPFIIVAGATATAIGAISGAVIWLAGTLSVVSGGSIPVAIAILGALVAVGIILVDQWDELVAGAKAVAFWIGDKLSGAFNFLTEQIRALLFMVPDWLVDFLVGGGPSVGDLVGVGTAGGPGAATGGPAGLDLIREERTSTSRVQLDVNVPAGTTVTTEGDLEDVELGLTMAPG